MLNKSAMFVNVNVNILKWLSYKGTVPYEPYDKNVWIVLWIINTDKALNLFTLNKYFQSHSCSMVFIHFSCSTTSL